MSNDKKWTAGKPPIGTTKGYYLLCAKGGSLDVGYHRHVVLRKCIPGGYPPGDWGEGLGNYTIEYWRKIGLEFPESWQPGRFNPNANPPHSPEETEPA